jgi:hypothetical protein
MERFIACWDTHYGHERRNGRLSPLHDQKAIDVMLRFAEDFKPHTIILGGDILDCGAVSHHNKGKAGKVEGLRLAKDAELARERLVKPLNATLARPHRGRNTKVYIPGNHEDWLNDLLDDIPGLEGIVDASALLGLDDSWTQVEVNKGFRMGELYFIHGDQIRGGEHVAKAAVLWAGENVRFGHYHTHQTYTMTSVIENKLPRTGIAVPCLCTKDPKYNEGKPNKWSQGFLYGYMNDDGTFHDYVVTIIEGKAIIEGKEYRG